MEYYESVHKLSMTIFKVAALSLGFPEGYFDYFASDPDGKA